MRQQGAETTAVISALSAPRMSTYLTATGGDAELAIGLYGWNARIAAALMVPAHIAEVTTRNAVDEALSSVYGPRWPWDSTFEGSLAPKRPRGYSPREDLRATRSNLPTTGQVVADLHFIFWERMFTASHDVRVWRPHISDLFPGAGNTPVADLRNSIRRDLETIRRLRNRIAHHEPIFTRDLAGDLRTMLRLIEIRSSETADLAGMLEDATNILTQRP